MSNDDTPAKCPDAERGNLTLWKGNEMSTGELREAERMRHLAVQEGGNSDAPPEKKTWLDNADLRSMMFSIIGTLLASYFLGGILLAGQHQVTAQALQAHRDETKVQFSEMKVKLSEMDAKMDKQAEQQHADNEGTKKLIFDYLRK